MQMTGVTLKKAVTCLASDWAQVVKDFYVSFRKSLKPVSYVLFNRADLLSVNILPSHPPVCRASVERERSGRK